MPAVYMSNNGEPLIFTSRILRSSSTRFTEIAHARANKIVILTEADGDFIPDIDFSSFGNVADRIV